MSNLLKSLLSVLFTRGAVFIERFIQRRHHFCREADGTFYCMQWRCQLVAKRRRSSRSETDEAVDDQPTALIEHSAFLLLYIVIFKNNLNMREIPQFSLRAWLYEWNKSYTSGLNRNYCDNNNL